MQENNSQENNSQSALFNHFNLNFELKSLLHSFQGSECAEFIFRDAKQFTGLCDAQTPDLKRLDVHFNACLTALNLAKYEVQLRHSQVEMQS
jgi:hypothetical protein